MSYMITAERQSLLSAELAAARTQSALLQALERTTVAFGFNYFLLMNAPAPEDAMLGSLLIDASLPRSFVRDLDRGQMLRSCPMINRTRNSVLPQPWHMGERVPIPEMEFSRDLQLLLLNYKQMMGMTVPVNSMDGQRLIFWYSGNRNSLSQSETNELVLITLQALDSYNSIKRGNASAPHSLSARELEVIRWTAQGKTSVEIGQILSLSDHTINAYMTNAIKKLDCVNRTQLVAKAIRLKLIN
jgi:DNA-binding CsgD family transcriptional regulator